MGPTCGAVANTERNLHDRSEQLTTSNTQNARRHVHNAHIIFWARCAYSAPDNACVLARKHLPATAEDCSGEAANHNCIPVFSCSNRSCALVVHRNQNHASAWHVMACPVWHRVGNGFQPSDNSILSAVHSDTSSSAAKNSRPTQPKPCWRDTASQLAIPGDIMGCGSSSSAATDHSKHTCLNW